MVVQSEPSGPRPPTGGSSRPFPVVVLTLGVILLVLAVVLVLVVVKLTNSSPAGKQATAVQQASSTLVQAVTSIPAQAFDSVGDPSQPVVSAPVIVRKGARPTVHGLPAVVWVGALYCPGCAAERWALVIALGRFGTFDKLYTTTSAASDVFAGTATFSLEGAEFTSRTVALSAVEEYGNQPSQYSPAGYQPLGHLDALQSEVMKSYDRAPWVQDPTLLPFLDVANRMIISGWSFSPGLLSGLTADEISKDLADPSDPVAQALLGTANQITAAICAATGGRPADVCETSAIESTMGRLGFGSQGA